MDKIGQLLSQQFDRMSITSEDFERFNANMAATKNGAQGSVNRALYATIAQLKAELDEKGSGGGSDGAAEIERLMKTDYSIYIYVSRATANILAVNTVGNYIAGKPIALPYVLFGYNDQNSSYAASLKNSLGTLKQAVPNISYSISGSNGTQIWTWTDGVNTDKVNIYYAGQNTNYLNLVQNQSQNPGTFYSRYTNYVISDPVNGLIQGTQADIQWVTVSSGGFQTANEIFPDSLKTSFEYLPGRWNLKYPRMHYDATLSIVDSIIACPAADIANGQPFIVAHNMFCDHHESHKSKRK